MAFVYVVLSMLGVAAIALLMSTLTDSAVAAALGHDRLPGRLDACCSASMPPTRSSPTC